MELIMLLGQTSSGKSELAVEWARQLPNSVIISCDSRQVYKGLNLLSGKIEGNLQKSIFAKGLCYVYKGIEHFMIDNVELNSDYNLKQYIDDYLALVKSFKNVDYVIITGGTGLYARAIYDEYQLTTQVINQELKELTLVELQSKLNQTDFNNSDWNNKVRLINRLNAKPNPQLTIYPQYHKKTKYILRVGRHIIKERIHIRIVERIQNGMIQELESLINQYGYAKFMSLGLESRYCAFYLLGMINLKELVTLLELQTIQYAKRQLTWLDKERDVTYVYDLFKPDIEE